MVARLAPFLLLTALLAGCAVEEPGDAADAPIDSGEGQQQAQAQQGQASQQPAQPSTTHGQFKRQESAVTVTNQGGSYQARKTVTFTNGFGGAQNADVALTTNTGGVDASAWGQSGYEIVATLSGSGSTEQEARDRLAQMKVTHTDNLASGRIVLDTKITGPGGGGLKARLPDAAAYRLDLNTDTGGVGVSGLRGPAVTADADTGGIDVDGDFATATLTTDTGGIAMEGRYANVRAIVGTGGIDAVLTPSASGKFTLQADTGGIDLELGGSSSTGFDIEASADTGGVDVDVAGTSDVGTQSKSHKHVRSNGYDGKAVKCQVVAETGTGGVDVYD